MKLDEDAKNLELVVTGRNMYIQSLKIALPTMTSSSHQRTLKIKTENLYQSTPHPATKEL